jgi:hypothetical protein
MNREWTEEEIDILRRDRAAKIPVPVTAAKLNRPIPATYLRARMIGTQVQKHRSWGEEEVTRLRALVTANPPMTDRRIAEELGRTITQIRWKMQDLGLVGVRDLSKLAKATSLRSSSKSVASAPSSRMPLEPRKTAAPLGRKEPQGLEPTHSSSAKLVEFAVSQLAGMLDQVLRNVVAESEKGMMQAAMAAIIEKKAIDARLAKLAPSAGAEPRNDPRQPAQGDQERAHATPTAPTVKGRRLVEQAQRLAATVRRNEESEEVGAPTRALQKKPASRPPSPLVVPVSPPLPPAPRIVVLDAPLRPRSEPIDSEAPQMSGRGGWKSVRRDRAKVAAQGSAKSAKRSDAVDLAHAAQAAIEQFIAQRGVTRSETGGPQAVVTRLQARGYIVVSDGSGWVIDQRHRVANDEELQAFAAARGIRLHAVA